MDMSWYKYNIEQGKDDIFLALFIVLLDPFLITLVVEKM